MAIRLLPGTTLAAAFPAPPEPPVLSSINSMFELEEYISLLLRLDAHAISDIVELPTSGNGEEMDKWMWVYEQMRRLVQDMNHPLITGLQVECTRSSCPEMKAQQWTYLCSAHGATQTTMGQCCAIDYILHTMDHATAQLNSSKNFPSRLSVPQSSQRIFPAIARRLARVFAHAYFHHREVFEESEAEHSVYARFNSLVRKYDILEPQFLMIPASSSAHSDSEDDNVSLVGLELTRTDTMMEFESRNLADVPPPPAEEERITVLQRSASSASHEAANAVEEAAFTPSPAVLASSPSRASVPIPEEAETAPTSGPDAPVRLTYRHYPPEYFLQGDEAELASIPEKLAPFDPIVYHPVLSPSGNVTNPVIYPPIMTPVPETTPSAEEEDEEDAVDMEDVVEMDIVDHVDELDDLPLVPPPPAPAPAPPTATKVEEPGEEAEKAVEGGEEETAKEEEEETPVSEALKEAVEGRIDGVPSVEQAEGAEEEEEEKEGGKDE